MNEWLVQWGLESLKPFVSRLLLPPASLLLLALLAWLLARRLPRTARALGLLSLVALWGLATPWAAHHLQRLLVPSPPALSAAAIASLADRPGGPRGVIVVLGSGRRSSAPEYGGPDLTPHAHERLRYGAWLARQTRLPLAYSGGIGHGAGPGQVTEADAARQALARDGAGPLRWAEDRSRDTSENAAFSVALLQADGVRRIVLVTHDFHQPRALAAFRRAIARSGRPTDLVPAPMGQRSPPSGQLFDYLPEGHSLQRSTWVLHEWLGRRLGA